MPLLKSLMVASVMLFMQSDQKTMTGISKPPLHNIDEYDKAGPYEVLRKEDGTLQLDQIDRIRGWLWSHWSERRLGLLIVRRYSVEGEQSTYYYYIEPDAQNKWRIAIKRETLQACVGQHVPECRIYVEYSFAVYSLIRSELSPNADGSYKEIPPSSNKPSATYVLSFRDENGKELATL